MADHNVIPSPLEKGNRRPVGGDALIDPRAGEAFGFGSPYDEIPPQPVGTATR